MEFIIASHNQKKIREMDAILGALGISFSPLPEGAPEPEETGTTFEGPSGLSTDGKACDCRRFRTRGGGARRCTGDLFGTLL